MTKAVNHIKYTQPLWGGKCQISIKLKKVSELAKWGVLGGGMLGRWVVMGEGDG